MTKEQDPTNWTRNSGTCGTQVSSLVEQAEKLARYHDHVGALTFLRQALELAPYDVEIRLRLAASLYSNGNLLEAMIECREVLRQQPGESVALRMLGDLLQKTGDFEGAISAYREALQLNPRLSLLHLALGYLFKDLGRREEAAQHLHEFILTAPKARAYQNRVVQVRQELEELEQDR